MVKFIKPNKPVPAVFALKAGSSSITGSGLTNNQSETQDVK